jgi:site-specific DNA-methyltransferase (adenine-specific)
MVFTDPPYGHNNNNGDLISRREAALGQGDYIPERDNRPIANDGAEANELFKSVLPELNRLLRSGGCCCCCCCCGGGGPDPMFARWSLLLDEIFDFKQMVVWDKGPIGMGWHYRRSYETVLVAQKRGGKCKWYDKSQRVENIIRPGAFGIKKLIPSASDHPTQKPVALAEFFIKLHTQPGEVVLDPFLGSGSTAIAAKKLRRRFIGIELNPEYVKMAEERLKPYMNQMALFNGTELAANPPAP